MFAIYAPNAGSFQTEVDHYFTSLEWLYLTNRYSVEAQGMLLRVLTISGLDAQGWRSYSAHLMSASREESAVLQLMNHRQNKGNPIQLKLAIAEIWAYAINHSITIEEPPLCPVYLMAYGYTQESYLADLEVVYGQPPAQPYATPWPIALSPPHQPSHSGFLRRAVAVMGTTAGAIERLVEIGTDHGHDNE